jgi:hypothetical protein
LFGFGFYDSPERLNPNLALFEGGRSDLKGTIVIAIVGQLQFFTEKLIGIIDISLIDFP